MGSFKAVLGIGDRKVDLLFCQFSALRQVDNKNRVSSRVRMGEKGIHVRFEVTENVSFLERMLNQQHTPIQGITIEFYNTHDEALMNTLTLNNAYITGYNETFDFSNDQPHTALMTIHAEEMAIGNASIHGNWPVA